MTSKKVKEDTKSKIPNGLYGFHIEGDRIVSGILLRCTGIMGVDEYSKEEILLKSHRGRMLVKGNNISLAVFEQNTIELSGKIEELKFIYGKS